jgi:hypothetical protein
MHALNLGVKNVIEQMVVNIGLCVCHEVPRFAIVFFQAPHCAHVVQFEFNEVFPVGPFEKRKIEYCAGVNPKKTLKHLRDAKLRSEVTLEQDERV